MTTSSERKRPQEFYTIAEIAERWRVSVRHVRRQIENGNLKVTRFGKAVRVSAANLALYEATQGL
jgi:excisionase family DNA binding protein